MARYQRVSAEVMALLRTFSPLVEPVSVDEAFLDLTGTEALLGPPEAAGRLIKRRIFEATRLTASAGIAANKFVAKIASDLRKPDGLVVVPPGGEAAFLAPLPVERLWGVGKVTAKELGAIGVTTIRQLQRMSAAALERRFGGQGAHLHALAFGRDDRPVAPDGAAKSVGAETTFGEDSRDLAKLERTLRAQAERVARELRAEGVSAACVTLKLRYASFRTITRSETGEPTQDGLAIYRRVRALLARVPLDEAVRLVGVSASGLGPQGAGQLSLLDPSAVRRERLDRAVDRLTARFGERAVLPAVLVPPSPKRTPRRPLGGAR
jgi:DNA polymerase-4